MCSLLPAPEIYVSKDNDWCLKPDVEAAKKLLDEAGWLPGPDGIRQKNGVRMSMLYQTSTNSVRQAVQTLIKDMWRDIGVETELKNVAGAVFFGADPGNLDNAWKFYADVEMYADNFDGTDPENYMSYWTCKGVPTPQNGWTGNNLTRYCSTEYDGLVDKLSRTAPLAERAEIVKRENKLIIDEGGIMPLVYRGNVSARAKTLEGVRMNPWDSELWNAADWTRAK